MVVDLPEKNYVFMYYNLFILIKANCFHFVLGVVDPKKGLTCALL